MSVKDLEKYIQDNEIKQLEWAKFSETSVYNYCMLSGLLFNLEPNEYAKMTLEGLKNGYDYTSP